MEIVNDGAFLEEPGKARRMQMGRMTMLGLQEDQWKQCSGRSCP